MLLGVHHLAGILILLLFLLLSQSDHKFHRIPNFFVAALFIGELLFLQGTLDRGTVERFVVTLALYFSLAIATQGALGAGDIKLAWVLSLLARSWSDLYRINAMSWLCAAAALPVLILFKRRGGSKMGAWREIRIPFAPFLIAPACLLVFKRW
jgi:Flp pilus assembly protein protease CpaA